MDNNIKELLDTLADGDTVETHGFLFSDLKSLRVTQVREYMLDDLNDAWQYDVITPEGKSRTLIVVEDGTEDWTDYDLYWDKHLTIASFGEPVDTW